MEDARIVELYWERDEAAIAESARERDTLRTYVDRLTAEMEEDALPLLPLPPCREGMAESLFPYRISSCARRLPLPFLRESRDTR